MIFGRSAASERELKHKATEKKKRRFIEFEIQANNSFLRAISGRAIVVFPARLARVPADTAGMRSLAALAVILLSIIIYVVLAIQFGLYQKYPVPHFISIGIGLFLLAKVIAERFTIFRLLLNIAGWILALFFVWWTLSYSKYEDHNPKIALGAHVDVLSLAIQNSENENTTLQEELGDSDAILLVFYRGHW